MTKILKSHNERQPSDLKPRTSSFGTALERFLCEEAPTPSPPRKITNLDAGLYHDMGPPIKVSSPSGSKISTRKASTTITSPVSTSLKRSAPTSAVDSPPKKNRSSSGYAPPSKYAHLTNLLTDSLAPNLICIFIGVNPGVRTATTGHAYSHPSNLFWKLCHSSGCTPRLCKPAEDQDLPHLYALGHTNIVSRPTKDASELSATEMDEGVAVLEEKITRWRPESVCIVGKGIWESIWRVRHGKKVTKAEFKYGWQDISENMGVLEGQSNGQQWKGASVFVATTTSGLAAGMRPHEKEEVWRGLGEWVTQRRKERGIPDEGGVKVVAEKVKEEAES